MLSKVFRWVAVYFLFSSSRLHNLALAYEKEQSKAAKDAMAQILINSRIVRRVGGQFVKTRE